MGKRLHTREESGIVLDREGRWFHDGEPVEHPRIVEAFNRGVGRAPDGRYVLRFGDDWCFITVEDAPLLVNAIRAGGGRIELSLSNGTVEALRPETLSLRDGVLYAVSADGLPAKFSRAAHVALGSLLEERSGGWVLVLEGREHPIAG